MIQEFLDRFTQADLSLLILLTSFKPILDNFRFADQPPTKRFTGDATTGHRSSWAVRIMSIKGESSLGSSVVPRPDCPATILRGNFKASTMF